MCLLALRTEEFKIASKDITCYKVVSCDDKEPEIFHPIYYNTNYKYEKGNIHTTNIGSIDYNNTVKSYDLKEHDEYGMQTAWRNRHKLLIAYTEGFHSASNKARLNGYKKIKGGVLVRCTIPKGSKYLINKSKLIISNQIRIDEVISN